MPKYYDDPNTGQRVEIKKTHRFRNFVVLPVAGLFAVGIAIGTVSGGGGGPPAPAVQQQPATAPPGSQVEVFGDGKAMMSVTVGPGGMSSNDVTLPETKQLPEGQTTVSVTRSPSVESYTNGGHGDSGDVGCRIIRDGKVVDEKTASGQFASVSCSKFY